MGRKKKRKKQRAAKNERAVKKRAAAASARTAIAAAHAVQETTTLVVATPEPAGSVADAAIAAEEAAAEATAPAAPPSSPPVEPAPSAPPASPTAEAAPSSSAGPESRRDEQVEDLDADLDADDASYESLVAIVANMPEEDAPASPPRAVRARTDRDADAGEEIVVVDLDDESTAEPVEKLIAKAVLGAPAGEVAEEEEEASLIDLDVDVPPPSAARAIATARTPTAGEEAARLALAAARGGDDDDHVTSFSVDEDEESTPETRARLLAQALAHAEHQEARYRVPTDTGAARRWKALVASAVFVLAGWVAAAPPGWVRPEPPARLNATARARSIRTALLLQAQQVEAFRVEAQRLPTTLDELPGRLPGIAYARSGNRAFQLVAYEPDGDAIIYDSTDPSPAFRSLLGAWPPPDGAP